MRLRGTEAQAPGPSRASIRALPVRSSWSLLHAPDSCPRFFRTRQAARRAGNIGAAGTPLKRSFRIDGMRFTNANAIRPPHRISLAHVCVLLRAEARAVLDRAR